MNSHTVSITAMVPMIWSLPCSGTASQASRGAILLRDSKDTSEDSIPGKCHPRPFTHQPTNASIATRECLSSAARNQQIASGEHFSEYPTGSKKPTGGVMPGMSLTVVTMEIVLADARETDTGRAFGLTNAEADAERRARVRTNAFIL